MNHSITILLIGTIHHEFAKFAIQKTIENIDYDEIITFSNKPIHSKETFIKINEITSIKEYSYFCLKCLLPFIKTSHVLIIQHDGFATNKLYWDNEYLDYDYIGAPWVGPKWDNKEYNVGNGGFSLRSKSLLTALQDKHICLNESIYYGVNEDYIICSENRKFLEDNYNIRFAPKTLAEKFSNEYDIKENTFGFHGLWNIPFHFSEDEIIDLLPTISIKHQELFIRNCHIKQYHNITSIFG